MQSRIRRMFARVSGAAAVVLALSALSPLAAQQGGDWAGKRRAEFARWQAANADGPARIAGFKRATAALVQQHRDEARAATGKQAEAALARSRGLSASQRAEVAQWQQQAAAAAKAGDCATATATFARISDTDPMNAAALLGTAGCLRTQGKLAEAADYYTRTTMLPLFYPDTEAARLRAMMEVQRLPAPRDPRVDEPPAIFRVDAAPKEVWDAFDAPIMTVIPAGEFTMGSPVNEEFYLGTEDQHRVTIGYPLAFAKYNVTRGEFAAFVQATGYVANDGDGCNVFAGGTFKRDPKADWRTPGFPQSDEDPVVCVNFYDAQAYAAWLSQKTGQVYRLPSEAEWEFATRAGTTTAYYWGDDVGKGHANCDGCNSSTDPKRTTPGGTFPPNAFGLYDMSGNVWKWLADCWNGTYAGAPSDGSAWMSGNCALRGRRTGSWFNLIIRQPGDPREAGRLRAAGRFGSIPTLRYASFGFRVVRDL